MRENVDNQPSTNEEATPSLLLSADKVAEILDISVRTLWRLRATGKLPTPVRLGGSVRWRAKEIETWVAEGCPKLKD